ncbi:MAG: outer membrane beta-barrel protein [Prevotella sp.]|nr:outer membrane beta-barrel protein [Prevotella sp.]
MKKMLVMAVAALMATMSVQAQNEQKNEVGVFYGVGSASNLFSVYTGAFAAAAGDQSSFWGPIGVEYYYHVSPVVGVGAVAAYASCKAEDKKTNEKDLSESFFTVMPSVKFNWLRKKHFGMYSGLSAGVMILSVSPNDNAKANDPDAKNETLASFMFQATALGMEFGGQQFRGFVEAGIGEKGVLCAGLRYKF